MALLYAAKINWLILSEPSTTKEIFTNIFENTLNEWPKVPNVNMRSATNSDVSVWLVTLSICYVNVMIPFMGLPLI